MASLAPEEQDKTIDEGSVVEETLEQVGSKRPREVVVAPVARLRRGRPPKLGKVDHLAFSLYSIREDPTLVKSVDRQKFFGSITFHKKESVDNDDPETKVLKVGQIVCLWPYGDELFVVHALYCSEGGKRYKLVGQHALGKFEKTPPSPNPASKAVPNKNVECGVEEVWHVLTQELNIEPSAFPEKKAEEVKTRKKVRPSVARRKK